MNGLFPGFRRFLWPPVAFVVVVAAIGVGYANSLRGGFVYDDVGEFAANTAFLTLWPPTWPMLGGVDFAGGRVGCLSVGG
ncbi:MAG: hypothetical protein ACK6CT_14605, partial [Planctomycetia bacterium]